MLDSTKKKEADAREIAFKKAREKVRKELEKPEVKAVYIRLRDK